MSKSTENQYDMGYTPTEFSRVLNGNFTSEKSEFNCKSVSTNHWLITHQDSVMSVNIHIEKRPDRILGAIALPVLSASFKVNSSTTQQSEFFFEKFFKYFHKGGG